MRRFSSLIFLFLATLSGVLYAAEPAAPSTVDTSSIKAVTAVIAGRTGPAAEKTEAAITAALKDPAILSAMQEFAQTRKAFLVDRKKAPAERDASLEKRYQQSLSTTVEVVRKAIVSQDASLAALSVNPGESAPSQGVTGSIRVVAVELIGQAKLTDEEVEKVRSAIAAVAVESKIQAGLQLVGQTRGAYLNDKKKFSAEQTPEIKRNFQKALTETTAAVRSAVIAKDSSIEPLINGSKKAQEYEGEGELDSAARNKLAVKPIKDIPGLPRVLLIGDSISIGYTLNVRALLEGKANVHRIPGNGGATEVGLEKMKEWLRGEKWDVIHFNFGLHDAKFASETTQRASREQYADNLRELIKQMKATGATLIFATTTPVPKDGNLSPTRRFDSIPARNEVARKVMEENGVAVNDLYAVVLPAREKIGRENDVHFGAEGYDLLAKHIAEAIAAKLPAGAASR